MSLKKQGDACYKKEQFQEAISLYTEAIGSSDLKKSDLAKIYGNRGACWLKMKEYSEVVDDCSAAIAIDPHYTSALLRRAMAYEAAGDLVMADADLLALLAADPENSKAKKLSKKIAVANGNDSDGINGLIHGLGGIMNKLDVENSKAAAAAPEPAAKGGGNTVTTGRPFDESRLLKDGEWEEWDKLMETDANGTQGEADVEALIEQQLSEARAELLLRKGSDSEPVLESELTLVL